MEINDKAIQTVGTGLVLAGIIWLAATTVTMSADLRVLANDVGAIKSQLSEATADRYRGTEAHHDNNIQNEAIAGLDDRVRALEQSP